MYNLPKLSYDLNGLEPVISAGLLDLHYSKHHQAYITNLNAALEKFSDKDLRGWLLLEPSISFNGGGHLNHLLFWESLAPISKTRGPNGKLLERIDKDFGSFQTFMEKFNALALSIQGSGWCFLAYDHGLKIITTANHGIVKEIPLMVLDMWEHAYYLQYKNVKADYVKAIWKIFNWPQIEKRFESIL